MREVAELARAQGLEAVVIPYPESVKARGVNKGESIDRAFIRHNIAGRAAQFADMVAVQAQPYQLDPARYENFVRATAAQARAANPAGKFMAELSTGAGNPKSAGQLVTAYRSVADAVDGFYLSVTGTPVPAAPGKHARMAVELLRSTTP